jgi:hypothetical protein
MSNRLDTGTATGSVNEDWRGTTKESILKRECGAHRALKTKALTRHDGDESAAAETLLSQRDAHRVVAARQGNLAALAAKHRPFVSSSMTALTRVDSAPFGDAVAPAQQQRARPERVRERQRSAIACTEHANSIRLGRADLNGCAGGLTDGVFGAVEAHRNRVEAGQWRLLQTQ